MTTAAKEAKEKRIIHLNGKIDEESVKTVVQSLIDLEEESPMSDILLYIDSYGGECYSLLAIHDAIKMCRCDVATICVGKAMSAAQMILMSGTKGKRFITPNSCVLMHSVSTGFYGNIHEMDNEVKATKELQKQLESLIKKYTNLGNKQIKDLMSKDSYITAKEALKMGIVDHIIDKPNDLHARINTRR
jgi:ATP-dependent Clp protease, protease subunit